MGTIDSEYLNAKSPVESCHHGRLYIRGSHAQARPFQERKPQMKPITLLGTILMARQQSKLKNLMMTTSKWASSAKCRSSRAWEIIKKKNSRLRIEKRTSIYIDDSDLLSCISCSF